MASTLLVSVCGEKTLPVTLPWSRTSCSARTLVGISLANGINLQSIHSNARVENLLKKIVSESFYDLVHREKTFQELQCEKNQNKYNMNETLEYLKLAVS